MEILTRIACLTLGGSSFAFFLWVLDLRRGRGESTWGMTAVLLYWPMYALSVVALLTSVYKLFVSRGKLAYGLAALLCSPLIGLGIHDRMEGGRKERVTVPVNTAWETGWIINPLLLRYYDLHPENFRHLRDEKILVDGWQEMLDEEVEVKGFAEFVQAQPEFAAAGIKVRDGKLLDPWGHPFRFARDRDGDGLIFVVGMRVGTCEKGCVAVASTGRDGKVGGKSETPDADLVIIYNPSEAQAKPEKETKSP